MTKRKDNPKSTRGRALEPITSVAEIADLPLHMTTTDYARLVGGTTAMFIAKECAEGKIPGAFKHGREWRINKALALDGMGWTPEMMEAAGLA